jgi:predicted CoA-binding protein
MNPPDITTLLNMSESDSLDFKSGQYKFGNTATDDEKSELLKDIIAFANSFKAGDAFIVVGISEKNQRKDQVVGVPMHLKDNEVQQFVNSKTNRRVTFLVHSTTAEGQPIDVIQIAQKQERPLCLAKNFGKVKANEVWIRMGSSSAIATPDQIAAMVKSDQNTSLGEARIALEWAHPKTPQRLGTELTITGTRLVDPPPPPPKPIVRPQTTLEKKLVGSSLFEMSKLIQQPVVTNVKFSIDNGPSFEEKKKYAQVRASFSPLRIWLKNLAARNVSNVNVKIRIPKIEGLVVNDVQSLPKKPRGRFDILSMVHNTVQWDTHVTEGAENWTVEISAKTIQPQDEFWSSDNIYIATASNQTIDATASIFADDLAKPIEISLKINARVLERQITPEDLEVEDD